MIVNRQSEVQVDVEDARRFARRLRTALRLERKDFNVCLVGDREIRDLNAAHRGKSCPTDVLSFAWQEEESGGRGPAGKEWRGFLGDVVISAPTARRQARAEGHPTRTEIRWLILHGVLHLLGYDHETDAGQMTAVEISLREKLEGETGRSKGRPRQRRRLSPARRRTGARK